MPRTSNTAERRAQICAALIQIMAKHGYDGASVADVAKTAGLTPGLVHYHFKNKQEILLEVMQGLATRHLARLDARLATAGNAPRACLDACIDVHLGLGADADPEALACWIVLSSEALREAKVRTRFQKILAEIATRIARAIEAGVATGEFHCADVAAVASALVATIQGYFVLAATARSLIPRGSAATSTKRMAAGLLAAPAPTRRR